MFENNFLTADILCAMITVLGSVLTISITYYKTQKMKQFEIFFSCKARVYENFWVAVSNYFDHRTIEAKDALRCAVHCIGLYSSPETFHQVLGLVSEMLNTPSDISDYIIKISSLMRNDLDKTKKGLLH